MGLGFLSPQYKVVGLLVSARDRVRAPLLDSLFSDSFGLEAVVIVLIAEAVLISKFTFPPPQHLHYGSPFLQPLSVTRLSVII